MNEFISMAEAMAEIERLNKRNDAYKAALLKIANQSFASTAQLWAFDALKVESYE